ncbi:MAG: branched-chain amino acid aminotransferase [Proteobacteria bacterium]|nr:branched-chain amino acid aminotransferase [Pseudomonadota bacterium]MBI3497650.1 branched-chain amino acid aminotransferase [Pseudomonadota bacterium]
MALIPFDDRDGSIWFDGKLTPWREAKVHVLTHALHYASAVFEGERAYGGHVFHSRQHSERLLNSAKLLGFEIPYTAEAIDQAKRDTVVANNIVDGYVRPIAWRGSEMMGVSAQQSKIHLAIATWVWPSYFSPELRAKGIRLQFAKWRRPAPDTAPTQSKAAGLYMICTMSKHAAEQEGFQDALMLDWRGQVAEATGANVFFAIDGALHTPKPDCFLDGITRRTVMGIARERQIKVVERAIMPEEMAKASECFLTGTAAEITPVGEIGSYRFTPGPITNQLWADFQALVRKAPAKAA